MDIGGEEGEWKGKEPTRWKRRPGSRVENRNEARLFEVVDDRLLAARLEDLFHKFDMERVDLIGMLRGFARELQIQSDLVALLDDGALAGRHLADVKAQNALDGA